jgi:hypothetical protein
MAYAPVAQCGLGIAGQARNDAGCLGDREGCPYTWRTGYAVAEMYIFFHFVSILFIINILYFVVVEMHSRASLHGFTRFITEFN